MTILDEILDHKAGEVEAAKGRVSPQEMEMRARAAAAPTRGFRAALAGGEAPAVIAEVKRRSPSKGEIRADFEPVACARQYAGSGAAALSVLTDEHYFGGHLDFLAKIRAEVSLPILRKDFTIDVYQIDEARVAGADAILLIAKALSSETLRLFSERARVWGLDVLVEVHDEDELARALECAPDLLGVNNRDLATFTTDLATTERLAAALVRRAPHALALGEVLLVAESGIRDRCDIERLEAAGARAFLVGESLMRESDPGAALRTLRTGNRNQPGGNSP
ncbi:MAG: indole-3-glycerol phosphate synthase TrpC [bacterium]|nr:indole-3-glycerol phosphate synthase TrpC [bacterium]